MSVSVTTPHAEETAKDLSALTAALKRSLGEKLVAVVLFGSKARGDAQAGSDWDIFVVAKDLPRSVYKRNERLLSCLPAEWRPRVSLVAKTPEEFEASLPPLYLDLATDGVILYDTDEYMRRKLALIRRKIGERGLYRERRGKDFLWLWRTPPRGEWKFDWAP